MNDNNEFIIAEYNALRQEIINSYDHQNSILIFALTAVGAIAAFSLQQNDPFIVLFAFVALLPASAVFHNPT